MKCIRELLRPGAHDKPEDTRPISHDPPQWMPPLDVLPKSRSEVYAVFGDPGQGKPSKRYQRERMTIAKGLPGTWNSGRGRLYCHRLAEPYLRRALELAEAWGVIEEISRMGCYVHRHQRHDPNRPLSYHSWGIALDINPRQNRAQRFAMPREPWSPLWREAWPDGLSRELVRCFEEAGWSWGGRWRRFVDPMHFELTAR